MISDSTGETAQRLVQALEAQFPDQEFLEIRHPRVETVADLQLAVERMKGRDLVGLEYEPLYPYCVPGEGRAHTEELGRLAREARHPRRGGFLRLPVLVWRTLRLSSSSRELMTPYAPLLPLLSVPFLAAVALAALGVVVECAVALLVVILLAL